VVQLSENGAELWRASGFEMANAVAVDPNDGSVWVSVPGANSVLHIALDGTVMGGAYAGNGAGISVSSEDSSCWIADSGKDQVSHVTAEGGLLWRGLFRDPQVVAVNPIHGSCWVADMGHSQLVLLSTTADEIMRLDGFLWPQGWFVFVPKPACISSDRIDGSCWVADTGHGEVVHVGLDGTELWRGGGFQRPAAVCANAMDGSCWVLNENELVHLAADGTERWRGGGFYYPYWVSVDESDGSCWVADTEDSQLVHLELAPGIFSDVPYWHWAKAYIEACYQAGIVAGFGGGIYGPSFPVTRDQMAVYISRALAGGDEHIPAGPATSTFGDVPVDHWAYQWVEYAVANDIVAGYDDGTYRPAAEVDRGQMAVFVARAIVTPTDRPDLPSYTPPETATFSDVATDHWAYKYIEYIAQPSVAVTQGYPDGTYRPDVVVTRDQMAVYVQRAFQLPM
jgi:hypothetical protein